ncbi:MAG: NAD(P)H-hydrate dehydratase [Euryarchaeota archaeon]|nr:NAD(P)H-hydrate dehydratase [Euryarchaeota archaeon]
MIEREEVRVLDINSEYLGTPTEVLMENAGWALAQEITSRFGSGLRIAILCGKGNNGGDGFVTARALTKSNRVRVFLALPPSEIRTPETRMNFEKVEELHKVYSGEDLSGYDVIVDALLGVGSKGEPRGAYATMVRAMNDSGRPVVSADIPTGLGSPLAVRATLTVTFHDIKTGMEEGACGEMVVADVGIPADAERFVGPGDLVHYPLPSPDAHKGQNGRLLVVGGGPYTGAPAMAGLAAYRIGADLVFVGCPERVASVVASYSPNLIVEPLPGDRLVPGNVTQLCKMSEMTDAVLVGPGLGKDPLTMEAVRSFVSLCERPMVLDADALRAVSEDLDILQGKTGVLTPHHRELEVLMGRKVLRDLDSRLESAKELANRTGWTVLLKGPVDIITDGTRIKMNRTGNPGMSVGGTGDVLSGLTAGLLSKKMMPFKASRISAFLNGSAGDLAFEKNSYGLMASDLLERIPQVLRRGLSRT